MHIFLINAKKREILFEKKKRKGKKGKKSFYRITSQRLKYLKLTVNKQRCLMLTECVARHQVEECESERAQ